MFDLMQERPTFLFPVTGFQKNHASGVRKAHLYRVVLCMKKLHFVSRNWRKEN